jgi:transcriptional regulator with XRE-family HTH domain
MEEIGKTLKEARSRLGLTIEEVERSTRIRTHYLEALENGELSSLPSQAQARGFLRNYAEYLGLDHQAILQHYAEFISSQRTRPYRRTRLSEATTQPAVRVRTRRISSDLIIAAVITVAVLAVLIWGFGRVATSLRERTQAASPFLIPTFTPESIVSAAEAPVATEQPAQQVGTIQGTPTADLEFEAVLTNVVDLRLLVIRGALVIVEVDGEEVYRGRPNTGDLLEFQGSEQVRVTTGNGGGLRAFYRGEDQGLLGEQDEVVVRFWTLQGAITPTPTQTPEPTES